MRPLAGHYPECCCSVPTWFQDGLFLFILVWTLLLGLYYSCVIPLWLLLPQLLSFRVCYLHTLVAMLSAWAISCLLFLLLRLHACGHFVPRHILPCCSHLAGTTDYMLPIVLLHYAHFAPRYILPWRGHLCWCY